MIPQKLENTGRVTKKSSVRPPIEVDCSAWAADSVSASWTTAQFVKMSSVREAIKVNCDDGADEQREWEELQELIEALARGHTEDLSSTLDGLKLRPSFIRILLKIVARSLRDRQLRRIIRQLSATHPSGKRVAAVYGDIREVERILGTGNDDDQCLRQLENYAMQIIASAQRDAETAHPRTEETNPEKASSGTDEIW